MSRQNTGQVTDTYRILGLASLSSSIDSLQHSTSTIGYLSKNQSQVRVVTLHQHVSRAFVGTLIYPNLSFHPSSYQIKFLPTLSHDYPLSHNLATTKLNHKLATTRPNPTFQLQFQHTQNAHPTSQPTTHNPSTFPRPPSTILLENIISNHARTHLPLPPLHMPRPRMGQDLPQRHRLQLLGLRQVRAALQYHVAVPEVRHHAVSQLSRPEPECHGEGCEDAEVFVRVKGGVGRERKGKVRVGSGGEGRGVW